MRSLKSNGYFPVSMCICRENISQKRLPSRQHSKCRASQYGLLVQSGTKHDQRRRWTTVKSEILAHVISTATSNSVRFHCLTQRETMRSVQLIGTGQKDGNQQWGGIQDLKIRLQRHQRTSEYASNSWKDETYSSYATRRKSCLVGANMKLV